jgi:hemolysin III
MNRTPRLKTKEEEMWNSITHSVAFGTTLLGFFITDSNAGRLLCLSLAITFLFSILYHSTIQPSIKRRFRMLDMASIHMTIGVTGASWCWLIDSPIWWVCLLPALFGFVYTVVGYGSGDLEKRMVPLCLTSTLLCIPIFCLAAPSGYQRLMFFMGLGFYFGGLFFYVLDDHKWYHTIWHCFVYVGSLIHIWVFL